MPNKIRPIPKGRTAIGIGTMRLCNLYNLIFFSLVLLSNCRKKTSEITLLWDNQRATGISIPKSFTDGISDSIEDRLVVRLLTGRKPIAMLGNYKVGNDEIVFEH